MEARAHAHKSCPSSPPSHQTFLTRPHNTFPSSIRPPNASFHQNTNSDTMSAIADSTDGPIEVIKVLFCLYPGYNTLDVAGPLEILSRSLHNSKDKGKLLHTSISSSRST